MSVFYPGVLELISPFISLLSKKMLDMISFFLNLLRPLGSLMCCLLKVFHLQSKRMYILLFCDGMFYKCILSPSDLICHLRPLLPCFIFCLDSLPIDVNGVLKSPITIILLLISASMSINIYICKCSYIGLRYLQEFYSLVGLVSLSLNNTLLFPLLQPLFQSLICLKYYYPSTYMKYIFPYLHFQSVCLSV